MHKQVYTHKGKNRLLLHFLTLCLYGWNTTKLLASCTCTGIGISMRKAVYPDMTFPLFPNYFTICGSVIRGYRSQPACRSLTSATHLYWIQRLCFHVRCLTPGCNLINTEWQFFLISHTTTEVTFLSRDSTLSLPFLIQDDPTTHSRKDNRVITRL